MKFALIAVAILLMSVGQGFMFYDSPPAIENGTITIMEYDHLDNQMNQENGSIVLSIDIGEFK